MTKAKTGRKKTSPDVKEEILKHLRLGHTDKDACALAGVTQESFYAWVNGRPNKGMKPDVAFSDEVKKARLVAKDFHMKNIRRAAARGSWLASAWHLERKHRDEFALKVVSESKETIIHDFSEESAKRLAKYVKKSAA